MAFGWALVAYSIENDGFLQFCGISRIGKSYAGMEIDKLVDQYYQQKDKK